jgi:hypothetical protein
VKRFLCVIIMVFVFVVLICLPVIPISTAPVVPNPIYSFRMVTFLEILLSPFKLGIYYQWHWYTFAVILVLLVLGCLVGVLVFRKIGGPSRD